MKLTTKLSFFVSCPSSLEDLLENELTPYPLSNVRKQRGGIEAKADFKTILAIMCHSRIASRVYLLISSFNFRKAHEISNKLKNIWFDKYLCLDHTFKVQTLLSYNCALKDSSHFINLKVKDCVVDFFQTKYQNRPNIHTTHPSQMFLFYVQKSSGAHQGSLYIDLCGEPLSHRFYRKNEPISKYDNKLKNESHRAPLRENLAAALVYLTNWNKTDHFIDGMSGSGTLIIEALMQKLDLPPTFLRTLKNIPFSLMQQPWVQKNHELSQYIQDYLGLLNSKNSNKKSISCDQLIAIEKSKSSCELIKKNLKSLGLEDKVKINQADFLSDFGAKNSVVIVNPPYGMRLNEQSEEELEQLYYQIGESFKNNYPNSRCYIFTAKPELRKKIALKTSKRIELRNAQLDARLFEYIISD